MLTAYVTGCSHFKNNFVTVGLRQGDITCTLSGQAPASAKHIILECEPLVIRRRKIFEKKQPGEEAGLRYKILKTVKFTRVGWL